MTAVVDVVIPVFAIVLAGYLCGRFGVLGAASSEALNAFVYYVALPALFFGSMARLPVADILNWPSSSPISAASRSTGFAVLVARFLSRPAAALGLHGLAAMFANTGYMGIPLLITAFGPGAALPAILATVVNGAVIMSIYIVWIEADLSHGAALGPIARDIVRGVARSPLVLSAVAAIPCRRWALRLPTAVATFCDIIGAAAPPAALFAMGLFMVGRSMRAGAREVAWLTALKLILHPLATWVLASRSWRWIRSGRWRRSSWPRCRRDRWLVSWRAKACKRARHHLSARRWRRSATLSWRRDYHMVCERGEVGDM